MGLIAFMRDEGYRYDPELAGLCLKWLFAVFERVLK